MNTQKKYQYVTIMILILLFASGCKKDKKTTTKINRDGSCERTVFVESVKDTASPIPVYKDKTWNVRVEGDSEKVYVASKKFDDVNQMNNEYRDPNEFGIDIKFEKKFRWFYTYFDYKETYKSYFPFKNISLDSFLTKEEYAQYEKGDTSKAFKKRLDEFLTRNIFEEFYEQLVDSVRSLNDSSLPVNAFLVKKVEFINWLTDPTKNLKGLDILDKIHDIRKYLEKNIGLKLNDNLERQMDGISHSIGQKFQSMMDGGKYINEISMPGIILNTNANTVEGNIVSWKFDQDKFCYTDCTMTVESRIANTWATYATGGVLIVLVALLILPRLRRK